MIRQSAPAVFDRGTALHFNHLALRRGVSLSGIGRNPYDLDVFFQTALYFASAGARETTLARDAFFVRLEDFLARHAAWLSASVEEVDELMQACGCVAVEGERVTLCVSAAADAPTPEEALSLWEQADAERAKRRARFKAQLQEKNRRVNRPRGVPVDPEADRALMREALRAAQSAREAGEVPVGAVVAVDGNIVATAGNETITRHDPTAHAEIVAIRKAAAALGNERLTGAVLYVTLEPCAMCAAAVAHARIARVVWGADDPASGAMRSVVDVAAKARMNHRAEQTAGVEREACEAMLKAFFQERRRVQKKDSR